MFVEIVILQVLRQNGPRTCWDQAWDVLAGVTTANLGDQRRAEAKQAVRDGMWPDPSSPRVFKNRTQFIAGTRQ